MKTCIIEGCNKKKHVKLGYCSRHYYRYKVHGDPLGGRWGSSPGEPLNWIEQKASYSGEECLKWPFEMGRYGYGVVRHNGRRRVASRVMCEYAHGMPGSEGYDAAHLCGNGHKGCVNPRHLSWKTRSENNRDKIEHGTHREGEEVNLASITEKQAKDVIRIAMNRPETKQKDISEMTGVTVSVVGKILRGERWRFVSDRMGYIPKTRGSR